MTVIVLSFNVCLRTVNWHLLPSYWISEMLLVHLFQETSQVATVICIFYSCPIDYFMQSSMFILHWDISKADQNFYSWSASNFLQGNFLLAFYFKYKITLVITYPPIASVSFLTESECDSRLNALVFLFQSSASLKAPCLNALRHLSGALHCFDCLSARSDCL